MDTLLRLWFTAALLGLWVGGTRVISQLHRYPTTISKVGGIMLSLTACALVLLYSWEQLQERPSMLLFSGMLAAWFGPELPKILRTLLRMWMKQAGGDDDSPK